MKKCLGLLAILCLFAGTVFAGDGVLEKLKQIPKVSDVKEKKVEPFGEYYEFWFEQPIDHENPSGGTFKQKVLLGHKREKAPVIVELEGYSIWTEKEGELAGLLKGNQLTIEHRFFDRSVPEGEIPWKYLTIKQAAADQHEIIQALKTNLYPQSKWITTGISKGGQTTIFHRYFYPEDVDVSVPYVAPLNLKETDPRIERFLSKVGSVKKGFGNLFFGNGDAQENCFYRVRDFQLNCFKHIDELLPLFEKYSAEHAYTYTKVGSLKRTLELVILEFQFAFWQWGHECGNIPQEEDELESVFDYLVKVSSPSFFDDTEIVKMYPFFYAALTEIGMYEYNVRPFRKYMDEKDNIGFDFAFPENAERKPFDEAQMEAINHWLQTDAEKMLFIYGGKAPWGATAVDLKNNDKCSKYVRGDMGHQCRIKHFEEITKMDILDTLKDWLK
ncbi:S28 family serine protease [Odoribacter lunatus]|uniref:S28 family serine protease n=1 Tax=Odoribacter lunatus TaxID=2941335 RepID=UPI0020410CCA|nr:S28 family serine protease [Odoribacter lunatus]